MKWQPRGFGIRFGDCFCLGEKKLITRSARLVFRLMAVPVLMIVPGLASSEEIPVLHPAPNKLACKSAAIRLGEDANTVELCVLQGSFSHDKYLLKIGGSVVIQGIDDQTTTGIQASHKGKTVALRCPPQNVSPRATAAEIQQIVPGYTAEQAKAAADLMATSNLGMEVGRLCQVSVEGDAVMTVQVLFD
ncbi:hypothetical protein [Rubrivivax gelatinosus]|uniref:Uncharacterized protein n=1 Tax=Rubrivivax gelatinosus (strain NBRC 100245 / IL144) TaxID=983917 RepID=I0HTM1_RUBGI|nr:hypothetical protein [Rubrivivax gelatinosus]BAL96358.1 hypothetical protein RGE_30190 [Rubrivivax gelatinosus IL144]